MSSRDRSQTYATHRRYHAWFHFIGVPILSINILVKLVQAFRFPSLAAAWEVVVAMGAEPGAGAERAGRA